MERDETTKQWFGDYPPIGDLAPDQAESKLRELGETIAADQLAASAGGQRKDTFGAKRSVFGNLFGRFMKTTQVCGFLPDKGNELVPVSKARPDPKLKGQSLKVTLDGLHVARYPGLGTHNLLFDFAVQGQAPDGKTNIFHYNARFEARDGETVPVRNFPLFYGLVPSPDGMTFGFQTVNVASSFDEGLLDFLKRDDFKRGLDLAASVTPLLGQISEMAGSLTRWLAGQSKNAKVQEFRQGLDFGSGSLGGGLALGSYFVVQIPLEYQREWSWADWVVNPDSIRLVQRENPEQTLDFNHLIFGLHRMETK
jgi:hypothetical protein